MRKIAGHLAVLTFLAGMAEAAIETSPFPYPRPFQTSIAKTGHRVMFQRLLPVFGPSADTVRPRSRPLGRVAAAPAISAATPVAARSPWPRPRPVRVIEVAAATQQPRPAIVSASASGKICGDSAIRGKRLSRIRGKLRGCGVSQPVEVTSVDGIALSQPAVMTCETARALRTWARKGLKPAVGRLGGGVKSLRVIASYSCRTRNSRPGAKISEHGKGKAVDIAAINLANGKTLSVQSDWGRGGEGRLLKRIHKSACGPFGTVLGPNSDRHHKDHFHFDTASYRSGPYCR